MLYRALLILTAPHDAGLGADLVYPPAQPAMAPYSGLDTEQIKDKARKDLLTLLEGVSELPLPERKEKGENYF